ncbi:MAG: protein kinase [Planctomycetes bacterium]|nr:protein kinase [Planctomycetota bacterium]
MTAPYLVVAAPVRAEPLEEAVAELGEVMTSPEPGAALLALHQGLRPRAIVLDATGAALSPVEFLRGLRGLLGAGAPPVVALVEPEAQDQLAPLLSAGAADSLLLPFRRLDLLARIQARERCHEPGEPAPRQLDGSVFRDASNRSSVEDGGVCFGDLLVVGELSRGGITRVLKALRLSDGSLAAVKVLDPAVAKQDQDWSRRFEREQSTLAGVEHENLVRIRAAGTREEVPFVDMDFFAGETLDQKIDREGKLPPERALGIAIQVARGLKALHAKGVIHRDVKPENILIEPNGHVRVSDYGLSKPHDDAGLTQEGEILGTVAFIDPDLLAGGASDFAGDMYALGVTLFEMLTGKDAIEPGPPTSMFREALQGTAQTRAMQHIEGKLKPVVSRMLAVDPRDRYADIDAALTELERLVR